MADANDKADDKAFDEPSSGQTHAADGPTEVWTEDSLRSAGVKLPGEPRANSGIRSRDDGQPTPARPRPRAGFGWGTTMAVAITAAAVAYIVVRMLRP